jgi:hypothetical protein
MSSLTPWLITRVQMILSPCRYLILSITSILDTQMGDVSMWFCQSWPRCCILRRLICNPLIHVFLRHMNYISKTLVANGFITFPSSLKKPICHPSPWVTQTNQNTGKYISQICQKFSKTWILPKIHHYGVLVTPYLNWKWILFLIKVKI